MSLLIQATGPQALLQDAGRIGYAHLGVPRAGAFDRRSWHLANRLLGNPEALPVLECLGGGFSVEAQEHCTIAVTGAHGDVVVDGTAHSVNQPLHLRPSSRVELRTPRLGLRYYVAISGGFQAEAVLGSVARDTLGRIGPEVGQTLRCGPGAGRPIIDHTPPRTFSETFDVLPGPDLAVQPLLDREWDLDPQSNRIGIRLAGTPIPAPTAGLPSRPMILGAVQLPPNGLPIILGPDHPTTGGYPVIAIVTPRSMDDVAQWAEGPRRFRLA